jgi:hypothetical protein
MKLQIDLIPQELDMILSLLKVRMNDYFEYGGWSFDPDKGKKVERTIEKFMICIRDEISRLKEEADKLSYKKHRNLVEDEIRSLERLIK